MARTKTREKRTPRPSEEDVNAARKRVKTAMVERAAEVEKQCYVVVEALAVLRRLQNEVHAVDAESVALQGERGDDEKFCDLAGVFIPNSSLREMEQYMDSAVENVWRFVGEVVAVEKNAGGGDDNE